MTFDWATHAAHRQLVCEEQGTWIGLLDENMIPLMDAAPIEPGSLTAPAMRNHPGSFEAAFWVQSEDGLIHPMVDELVAEHLGRQDPEGRLVFVTDKTRFIAVQRAGLRQRVYKVSFVVARGPESGPVTLEVHATDELSMLQDHPAWSVPTSVTGDWKRLDRDWAASWTRERDVQHLQMAAQADGFTIHGPAEVAIRRLIRESLETSYRAAGVTGPVPIVVSRLGSTHPSPEVYIRPDDGPLWGTIASTAAAAGVTVTAWAWWPGDPQPAGRTLTEPTIVVDVVHRDAPAIVVADPPPPTPRRVEVVLTNRGRAWDQTVEGHTALVSEFSGGWSGAEQVTFTEQVTCDKDVVIGGLVREAGRTITAGVKVTAPRRPLGAFTFTGQSLVVPTTPTPPGSTAPPPPAPTPPAPRDVLLVADGAEMTVGRRTASHVYGAWDVVIPEGTEQDRDTRVKDAYIHRPDDAPDGRFDLAFIRADVSMDMNALTSNVENQLDAAQSKADGDHFFERDIEGLGLGRYTPGLDFDLGDVVDVLIWGGRVPGQVTAVDYSGLRGWRVHVGGQLLMDALTLSLQNDEVEAAIRTERYRAQQEAARLAEQAAIDRDQSLRIDGQQVTLSQQQQALRTHSAEMATWSGTMTGNFDIMRGLFNELRLQKTQWDLVAQLFEHYHDNSGALRNWAADSAANINSLIQQLNQLSPPPQP